MNVFEESVINKSLNFATTIRRVPYLDMKTPIEEAALKIPKIQADEIRWKVRLEVTKSTKINMPIEKMLAIKNFHNDASNMLPAYKGNTMVVLDKLEYSEKMVNLF